MSVEIVEPWQAQLGEIRELIDEITKVQKRIAKIDIVGKTISFKNEIDKVGRKLKTKNRTAKDIKKHMQLLIAGKTLIGVQDLNSPLSLLNEEITLLTTLHHDLTLICQRIIAELKADSGLGA